MRIVGYDPYASEEYATSLHIDLMDLESLYKESDFVSLHIPLNEQTKNMFDAKTLAKLKPGARLINCARGALIDEKALETAIQSGPIKGAALHVFEHEP